MLKSEYDAMMEAKGTPKVWIIERIIANSIYTDIYTTYEDAVNAYLQFPENTIVDMYRTWDIWNWTERHSA